MPSRRNPFLLNIPFPIALVLTCIITSVASWFFFASKISMPAFSKQSSDVQEKSTIEAEKTPVEYFATNVLPNYPDVESSIPVDTILSVKSLPVPPGVEGGRGWLLELRAMSETENPIKKLFLLTPTVQKELEQAMTDQEGIHIACELDQVKTVRSEFLSLPSSKNEVFLIISASDCTAYGFNETISVYRLSTGEKIPLQANLTEPGTRRNIVSTTGNAYGNLRGVFGYTKPMVVVEYGQAESDGLEEVRLMALFDLQTGKLADTIEFK